MVARKAKRGDALQVMRSTVRLRGGCQWARNAEIKRYKNQMGGEKRSTPRSSISGKNNNSYEVGWVAVRGKEGIKKERRKKEGKGRRVNGSRIAASQGWSTGRKDVRMRAERDRFRIEWTDKGIEEGRKDVEQPWRKKKREETEDNGNWTRLQRKTWDQRGGVGKVIRPVPLQGRKERKVKNDDREIMKQDGRDSKKEDRMSRVDGKVRAVVMPHV